MRLSIVTAFLLAVPFAVVAQSPTPLPTHAAAAQPPGAVRTLAELTSADDPAWPLVQQWVAAAASAEILPVDKARADETLTQLQVTLHATMGAVAYHTGGILIDHGWLRILGSGSDRMTRSIPSWNNGKAPLDATGRPMFVLVADDVLGGLFAIDGGALGTHPGNVFYFAPDTLQWQDLSIGYTEFLAWALTPRLDRFYRDSRWPGWQDEVGGISGDSALLVYPFLSAEGPAIAQRSRKVVPLAQLYRLDLDIVKQLGQ